MTEVIFDVTNSKLKVIDADESYYWDVIKNNLLFA